MPARTSLAAIITTARAGSLDYAWRLFDAGGYGTRLNDPAALAVKGRLLKDLALRLPPTERAATLAEAAQAYAAADAIFPQPYTKLNQATATMLAGNRDAARALAAALLEWMERQTAIQETPYFLAATRAEARLLLGDTEGARNEMSEAVRTDPDGWSDRATTLRQLSLILELTGEAAAWLDAFRPPRSLHYAGHLGIAEHDHAAISADIDTILAEEGVGFGYGALAAGGDILVAEALLRAGAELHVVLPVERNDFVAQSITPYAPGWRARFEACLAGAASLREMTSFGGAYKPLATQLSGDVAMGAAVLNARQLESRAVQVIVIDDGASAYGAGQHTAAQAERWQRPGFTQRLVVAPRSAPVSASSTRAGSEGRADLKLLALIHVSLVGLDAASDAEIASMVDEVMVPLGQTASRLVPQPLHILPATNGWIAALAEPEAALAYARALLDFETAKPPLRIAGHFGIVHEVASPNMLVGGVISELQAIASAAMPGTLTMSETLAAALYVGHAPQHKIEWIGELDDMRLFAVARNSSDQSEN